MLEMAFHIETENIGPIFPGDPERIVRLGIHDGRKAQVYEIGGHVHEADLLNYFWRMARLSDRFVGFGSAGFDLPVILRRSWILGVKSVAQIDPDGQRKGNHHDLRLLLCNGRAGEKDTLARFANMIQHDREPGASSNGSFPCTDKTLAPRERCCLFIETVWSIHTSMQGIYF